MMKLIYAGKTYLIPSHLSELTVGKFIEWQETYGNKLSVYFRYIEANSPELLRQLDLQENQDLEAESWFSFFTGLDISSLVKHKKISCDQIYPKYAWAKWCIRAERNITLGLPSQLRWKDDVWTLQDSQINGNKNIKAAGYLIDAVFKLGNGNWRGLLPICALYMRKDNEPFAADHGRPGSPRYELMKDLPLDYAIRAADIICAIVKEVADTTKTLHASRDDALN